MKKMLKNAVLALIMVLLLVTLVGCGAEKIVATTEDDGMKETIEVKFKDDVADEIKMTFECESKDDAKEGKEYFEEEMKDAKVKQSGKKVIVTMDMKAFAEQFRIDYEENKEALSKENLTKMFESMDYDVK